jgi:hypothetical protein
MPIAQGREISALKPHSCAYVVSRRHRSSERKEPVPAPSFGMARPPERKAPPAGSRPALRRMSRPFRHANRWLEPGCEPTCTRTFLSTLVGRTEQLSVGKLAVTPCPGTMTAGGFDGTPHRPPEAEKTSPQPHSSSSHPPENPGPSRSLRCSRPTSQSRHTAPPGQLIECPYREPRNAEASSRVGVGR